MSKLEYKQVKRWVDENAINQHPSEIHGLVAGWICAGSKWDAGDRHANLAAWLSLELDDETAKLLEQIYAETTAGLLDDEFGFEILVPPDETDLGERTLAVAFWCSGFLAGFGMTGRYQDGELGEDLKEVFSDLSRIAAFSEEVPQDDDNEADLIEISEYVRMSAMLIYTECAHKAVH